MKTLYYLIQLDFPTQRAYAKNVISTLSVLASQGVKVKVFAGGSDVSMGQLHEQYDMHDALEFNFSKVGSVKGKLIFMGLIQFMKVLFKRDVVISGRFIVPLYLLSFLREVNYEYHSPIWKQGLMYRIMFKRLLRASRCKSLVVPNKNLYLDFFKEYPELERYGKKINLVSNGASIKANSESPVTNSDILNLGYVGSFYPGKGLEVIEELSKSAGNCVFHLAGGPEELLRQNHPDLLKDSRIRYHGYLSAEGIDELSKQIDIFLLPNAKSIKTGAKSDIGRYTNPLKLFEYMSYYRPIICSDRDYLKDVLDELGFYCESKKDWLDAIDKLRDINLRQDYGQRIKEKFLSNFTINHRANKIKSILLS